MIFIFELISAVIAIYQVCIEIVTIKGISKHNLKASIAEMILNFTSPMLILVTQFISIFMPEETFKSSKRVYWELLAWTSFLLWFRFLLMLRSITTMSPAIRMVIRCFKEMVPYIGIVIIGILAFTDAFQSID